jgi:hypothetical protein
MLGDVTTTDTGSNSGMAMLADGFVLFRSLLTGCLLFLRQR